MAGRKKVMAKRKRRTGMFPTEKRTCGYCKNTIIISAFRTNKKLEGGHTPWCINCLEALRASGTPSRRKAYRAAYQRSYHNRRRAVEGVSRTVTKGARRLSKAILARRIPRELTLEAVRRESVQRDLLALMPALKKTKVWQGFEDEVIAYYEEKEVPCKNGIVRVLPIEYYPEFALNATNCVPNGVDLKLTAITFSSVLLGLVRLSACILEVLGCETETV